MEPTLVMKVCQLAVGMAFVMVLGNTLQRLGETKTTTYDKGDIISWFIMMGLLLGGGFFRWMF